MFFKVLKGSGFGGVKYNETKIDEGQAKFLGSNNVPEWLKSVADKKQYLDMFFLDKPHIKNKQFHAVLSVKGKSMSLEDIAKVADKLMKDLGYENSAYLIYGHMDTPNNHVHIVASRVDIEGKWIPDHYEAKKGLKILDKILDRNQKNNVELLNNFSFSSPSQVRIVAETYGYKMDNEETKFFRNGEYQGDFTQKEKTRRETQERRKRIRQLNQIFKRYEYLNKNLEEGKSKHSEFFREKFGLEFHFHINEKYPDSPYGLTIIDHKTGMAFKASEFNISLLKNNEEAIKEWVEKVLEKGVNDSIHLKNILKNNGLDVNKEGEVLYKDGTKLMEVNSFAWERLETLRKLRTVENAKFVSLEEMYGVFKRLGLESLLMDLAELNLELQNMINRDFNWMYYGNRMGVDVEMAEKILGNIGDYEEIKADRDNIKDEYRDRGNGIFMEDRNEWKWEEGFVMNDKTGAWMFFNYKDRNELDKTYEPKVFHVSNEIGQQSSGLGTIRLGNTGDGKGGILRRRKSNEEEDRERGR